jgi:hypothetical protein
MILSGLSECGALNAPTPSSGVSLTPKGLSYGAFLVGMVPKLTSWLTV